MKMMICKKLSVLCVICTFSALLHAGESFSFSSDFTEAILAEGREETILRGNAVLVSGATEIQADHIRMFGRDFQYASARGNIRIRDEEQDIIIRSKTLFYDREKEISRISGYNEMEDYKNELIVKSNYLEHHGGDRNVSYIQIGVRILKATDDNEMICTADFAIYWRDQDLLELTGSPEVRWKGDHYTASRIIIHLETDEIILEGSVRGSILEKED